MLAAAQVSFQLSAVDLALYPDSGIRVVSGEAGPGFSGGTLVCWLLPASIYNDSSFADQRALSATSMPPPTTHPDAVRQRASDDS